MNSIQLLKNKIDSQNLWEKELSLDRNEFLKVSGSVDTNLYYIVQGSLVVYGISELEEHIIRFGYKDNFIAALDSFITGKPSGFYIQALKKTFVKMISKHNFDKFINSSEENLKLYNTLLSGLIVDQMEREQDLLVSSPEERYNRVLKRSPQLFQEIPSKYIASYLRMTPETLSRIKKS